MVRFMKMQQDLLKWADKRSRGRAKDRYLYFEWQDKIAIVKNGLSIVLIPETLWYLDTKKIFNDSDFWQNGCRCLEAAEGASLATNTNTIITTSDGKLLQKFVAGDNGIYVNIELLKDFDLTDSTCWGTNGVGPLYIRCDGELEGLVLPVRYIEG